MLWAKRQRGWRGGRWRARESERASLTGCICSTQRTLFPKHTVKSGEIEKKPIFAQICDEAQWICCNKGVYQVSNDSLSLSLGLLKMIFTSASAISTAKKCTIQHCCSSSSLRALCSLPIRIIQESTSPQHVRFALLKHFTRLLEGLQGP